MGEAENREIVEEPALRVDGARLCRRLEELADIGAEAEGAARRPALTPADKAGRDLVMAWMHELGLTVTIDGIGNVVGVRAGVEEGPPVMAGSHIDTTGQSRYAGTLGVLAGLEVVQVLNEAGYTTRRPVAVAFFTNEGGPRLQPSLMGSRVYEGRLPLDQALATRADDGVTVAEHLQRIGYGSNTERGDHPYAFVELHSEEGPVLEDAGITIGAVDSVEGVCVEQYTLRAPEPQPLTTPMHLRHDPAHVAAQAAVFARELAQDMEGDQLASVRNILFEPAEDEEGLSGEVRLVVDLRNSSSALLQEATGRMTERVKELAEAEGVRFHHVELVNTPPVRFDPDVVSEVAETARELDLSARLMTSMASHDAQYIAPMCPTAMIFVPTGGGAAASVGGTPEPAAIEAGANVLLHMLLKLADM